MKRSSSSIGDKRGARSASPRFHPRNRHQGVYDFPRLVAADPSFARFLRSTPGGDRSIDFADPVAVRALNRALLQVHYGITNWDIPAQYLCPPVPGRADYIHGLADLLARDRLGESQHAEDPLAGVPRGLGVRVLDIGVGANCIYPLIGHREYGWYFVGVDIDPAALAAAQSVLRANPGLESAIELRLQPRCEQIFGGVLSPDERFDLVLCNPPFHASAREAAGGSARKWRNLGKAGPAGKTPPRNFGGVSNELWCPGGEAGFLKRMIEESRASADRVLWFSSLVSKSENLAQLRQRLLKCKAAEVAVVPMAQGNKQSRFLAWTFVDREQRLAWWATREFAASAATVKAPVK